MLCSRTDSNVIWFRLFPLSVQFVHVDPPDIHPSSPLWFTAVTSVWFCIRERDLTNVTTGLFIVNSYRLFRSWRNRSPSLENTVLILFRCFLVTRTISDFNLFGPLAPCWNYVAYPCTVGSFRILVLISVPISDIGNECVPLFLHFLRGHSHGAACLLK